MAAKEAIETSSDSTAQKASADKTARDEEDDLGFPCSSFPSAAPRHRAIGKKSNSRCSMLNVMRRESRSLATSGIAYEDQLAAIVDPVEEPGEKLAAMLRLAMSATLRAIQQEMEEEMDEDLADLAQSSVNILRRKFNSSIASGSDGGGHHEKLVVYAQKFMRVTCPSDETAVMSGRALALKNYVNDLEAEAKAWDKLREERKVAYQAARSNKKAVAKGDASLRVSDLQSLADQDAVASIGRIPDEIAEMNPTTKRHLEEKLAVSELALAAKVKAEKRKMAESQSELDSIAKKLRLLSEKLNVTDSASQLQTAEFAAQVLEWLKH